MKNNIIEIIQNNLVLLLGVVFFIYGLFNFSFSKYYGAYYYDGLELFLLITGAVFLTIGILKMKNN
jgi:hypothetical protein